MPAIILSDNGVSSGSAGLKTTASNDGILALQTTTAGGAATTAVTIDTSQNMGLGVTPSAWGSYSGAMDLKGGGALGAFNSSTALFNNSFYNGTNFIYKATTGAALYQMAGNAHQWFNAASGTAGNAITFTQAMTLDANGSLLVGETSAPSSTYRGFFRGSNASSDVSVGVRNTDSSGFSRFVLGNNSGVARFTIGYTGSTSSTYSFGASAAWLGTEAAEPLVFQTNGTERARITAAGVLLVGVTATGGGGSHLIQAGAGVNALQCQNNSTTPYGPYFNFSAAAPNNGTFYFLACADTSATRCLIYSNGGIANYQANNSNLSDRREKTNFAPAGDYLAKICAIPVQTFNYIDQNTEEDGGLTLGVVAQDVQAVAPELVTETNWADKDKEPKMRLSIYQTDLQYALMKSIQELKAEFDAYKLTHP